MSTYNNKTLKGVAEVVQQIMDEELKGNQHKIDANKNGKVDAHDFKLLRAKKPAVVSTKKPIGVRTADIGPGNKEYNVKVKEEVEEIEEGLMNHITIKPMKNNDSDLLAKHAVHYKDKKIGHIETYQHRSGIKYGNHHDASGDMEAGHRSMDDAIDSLRQSHADHLKSMKEEFELDEAFPTVADAHRRMGNYTKGTVTKTSTGLKHERNYKDEDETEEKTGKKGKTYGANQKRRTNTKLYKESFSSMLKKLDEEGIKALDQVFAEDIEQLDEKKGYGESDPLANRADYAKRHGTGQVYKKTHAGDKTGMTQADAYAIRRTGPKGKLPEEVETEMKVIDVNVVNGVWIETIEERTLTASETNKKEEIVKSMKKGLSGFKERYGKDAKSVMYATATKQAKKD